MAYTKKERRKLASVFKAAQAKLWRGPDTGFGGSRYICEAIKYCPSSFGDARWLAKNVIQQRLTNCLTVEAWLYKRGYIENPFSIDRELSDKTKQKIQAYRLAWLKELEREFSQ